MANDNFTATMYYDKLSSPSRQVLGQYLIYGLPSKESYNFTGTPKIQAGFRLNSNSILQLDKVEAEITVTTTTLVPKSKPLATSASNDIDDTTDDKTTEEKEQEEETIDNSTEDTKEEEVEEEEKTEQEVKTEEKEVEMEEKVSTKVHRVTLKTSPVKVPGMGDKDFANSKKILTDISNRLEAKKEREREKNNVESYIYDTRDKLDSDDIIAVSTEEQREQFKEELSNAGDWLYDDGRDATTSQYKDKLNSLKKEGDLFFKRASEVIARPMAVEYAHLTINTTRSYLHNITEVYDVTEEEKEDVLDLVDELEKWIQEKTEEQNKKAPHDSLAFTSDQVYRKCKSVENKFKPLLYKKIRKPKVEAKTPNSTTIDPEDTKIEETETEKEQEQESIEQNKEEL